MKITGADHTSFTVANLERSLEFYIGLLGLELIWRREITNRYFREIVGFPDCVVKAAHLRIPGTGHKLELFEYVSPRGVPADVRTNNTGSSHISLYVDGLQAAYEELKSKGVRFRSPPVEIDAGANKGTRSLYLLDPDGITVELFEKSRVMLADSEP
jgi:catechol 2,3-dioxygenase-like lactoylglutathione lyase family enzyme